MKKTIFIIISCTKLFICIGQNNYEEAFKNYLSGNDDKISIELFTKAIESNDSLAKSYMYRGSCKTYQGDYFGAISDLNQAVNLDSTNYLVYYYFGRIYYAQGFYQTAIKYFDKSILKNSVADEVYDFRALTKTMDGDLKNAMLDENIAIKIKPNNGGYYNNRGNIYLKLQLYNVAITDFDMAIKNGYYHNAYTNKGLALTMIKMYVDAIKAFDIAINKTPNTIDAYYYRGIAYKGLGKFESACLDFEKSAKLGYDKAKIEYNNCLKK